MPDNNPSTTPCLPSASADFWQCKLAAFLHDSPSKALDIRCHEERADAAQARTSLPDGASFAHAADHTAAAADRIPFPYYKTSGLSCAFDGVANRFRHPLDGQCGLSFEKKFASASQAEEVEQLLQPVVDIPDFWTPADKARADYFSHWRLWLDQASQKDARFAFLPADTRIPDHTIWNHTAITAAFATCGDTPALLRFQLGPVQEFITAARSTRDLWSASFLISWLMMTGLKKLTEYAGPDSVISPNLHGQPLFDLHWKKELWSQLSTGGKTRWESFKHENNRAALTTPNLPNVFLALVPAAQAAGLAAQVEAAIRYEWLRCIADDVFKYAIRPDSAASKRRDRFDRQIARHLSIAWQTTPFPTAPTQADAILEIRARAAQLPTPDILDRLDTLLEAFEKHLPKNHRDNRFYLPGTRELERARLNNIGVAWPLLVALNQWQLDAARQTRAFDAWNTGGWETASSHNSKDALNGREEMITGGTEKILDADLTADARKRFPHDDEVGATTLVKRLWHLAYLCRKDREWGYTPDDFAMPNTHSLALGEPYANTTDENADQSPDDGKYYAILAFDGDDMGQWVSGAKTPPLRTQLADYTDASGAPKGALEYFTRDEHKDAFNQLLDNPRPLNPAYSLQFSQALSNFALHIVPRIVAAHNGRLLYAGGDDVLAMLPAQNALDCASDLQRAFRGLAPNKACGIRQIAPEIASGFLALEDYAFTSEKRAFSFPALKDDSGNPIPILVPGPRATASTGIALAHFKAPLQDVVQAAFAAEKRAKKLSGKHAFAISAFKRSGEITEWDARFDAPGDHADNDKHHRGATDALHWILHAIDEEILSAKFPHRLIQLVEPYRSNRGIEDASGFDAIATIERDLDTVIDRQRGKKHDKEKHNATIGHIREHLITYLRYLPAHDTGTVLSSLVGLLTIAAFLARQPE